jgi:2-C-methyl-D-erythritol 2,4-cyclodiphosphate synthase
VKTEIRIGQGWDRHALVDGRPLVLGGVRIPFDRGLLGHSDGDVVAHAVADALLGAAGLPDLGTMFPSSDPRWRGVSSLVLLERVREALAQKDVHVINVDVVTVAEQPRLAPHVDEMKGLLATAIGVPDEAISLKAKSPEGVGALGRGEGVEARAVALVYHGPPDRHDG